MDTSLDITRLTRALKSLHQRAAQRLETSTCPRYTWLCTLEADLQPLNLGLNSAWKYTQDQEHWKHLVETATLQLWGMLVMMTNSDSS